MIRKYDADTIRRLADLFRGQEHARTELEQRGCGELALLYHFLVDESDRSFEILKEKKHAVLAAFCKAVEGERSSVKFLLDMKMAHWAAIANYINGDEAALVWLERSAEPQYLHLAKAMYARIKKEKDDNPFRDLFNAPI